MKHFDKNFFKKIDSEEKAYFLGILYADGYNWMKGKNKNVSISLQEGDLELLLKLNNLIGGNHSIYNIKAKCKNCQNQSKLQINSKILCQDLEQLGCVQNKSKVLLFPSINILPPYLVHHFIRGYFDGDGSVWEGKRYKTFVKDSRSKNGKREKVIHNVKFNFTGTVSVINGIQEVLVVNNIVKKNKINTSKKINNCVQLEYSGRSQMKKFYNYLYQDATIWLERKKQKFENIICASIQ